MTKYHIGFKPKNLLSRDNLLVVIFGLIMLVLTITTPWHIVFSEFFCLALGWCACAVITRETTEEK